MLTLPMLGLIILSIGKLADKKEVLNEMENLTELSRLSVKISAVVHEMQKERGLTAAMLGSKGERFVEELNAQRRETDKKVEEFKAAALHADLDKYKTHFKTTLENALENLNALPGKRNSISQFSLDVKDAIQFYTHANTDLLTVISGVPELSSNAELSLLLFSYVNLLQGKERAGIERAVLSNTFAAGSFAPGMFRKFSELVTAQKTYFNVFNRFVPDELRLFFKKKMSGRIVDEVNAMRDRAFKYASAENMFNVDAAYWFKMKTEEINLLKSIEDKTSDFFLDRTEVIRDDASTAYYSLLLMVIMLVTFSVVLSIFFSNRITRSLSEISEKALNIARGDLEQHIDYEGEDEIGRLADSFRRIIDSQKAKAEVAHRIAAGDLDVEVRIESKEDVLGLAMENMKKALQVKSDAAREIAADNLEVHIETASEKDVLGNAMITMVGNLKKSRDDVRRALNESEANLNKASRVVEEVNRVAHLLEQGNLRERAYVENVDGPFKQLVDSFNSAIDNIIQPILEANQVISRIADNDLTCFINGDYKGDHALMKNALNSAIHSLNNVLNQVNSAVNQVSDGARQVSDSSQSVAEGATEQASSLEEISASMTEISAQAKTNARNAEQAKKLAEETFNAASEGNKRMEQMMAAISDINNSSSEISKIIKVIEEIAFQTNLLALNAAVEAARAGVHGKGFAVVAEEVRNLAQRSAKAATQTTELIEGSVQKASRGKQIAMDTEKALLNIIEGVKGSMTVITEIAAASVEQMGGIEQTTTALEQIDKVTQANTASAEESAATSEQLSAQSSYLLKLVNSFKLLETTENTSPLKRNERVSESPESDESEKVSDVKEELIALDDHNFGQF